MLRKWREKERIQLIFVLAKLMGPGNFYLYRRIFVNPVQDIHEGTKKFVITEFV